MRKILLVLLALGVVAFAAEYQFSTGTWDQTPDMAGSSDGWGEWFVTVFENDTGDDVDITELGMPCCGPASGDYGWVVWYDVGGMDPPPGNPYSADDYGPYTPESPSDYTVYTYVDLSEEELVVEDGTYFNIGYDNTYLGGQIYYNDYPSWAWYSGYWDPESSWGRTDLIQCRAETFITETDPPYVDGLDPADGDTEVPVDSPIVFHCKDDDSGIDITTIDFSVQDTSLSGGLVVSASAALSTHTSPARTLPGDLDIDDTDINDVVCTWTGDDDFLIGEVITCTVAGTLADNQGNELGDDFVWT
ncbi:hypothetical protein KAU45_01290, partial [bacterium]|nr:hypothetical protein [bacterium]